MTRALYGLTLAIASTWIVTATAADDFGTFKDFGLASTTGGGSAGAANQTQNGSSGSAANPWADPAVVGAAKAAANAALVNSSLVVNPESHVVVMEYEAYFAPLGGHFNGAALPTLTSETMKAAGLKGYDSSDPAVIKQHAAWMLSLHTDIIWLDHSNNSPCTFDDTCAGKAHYLAIRDGNVAVYDQYQKQGIPLKIIPLLDGQDDHLFDVSNGMTALEKQIRFYKSLMDSHPNQQVIYYGKPLLTFYLGTPVEAGPRQGYIARINTLLNETGLQTQFTVRFVGGFLSNQPLAWQSASANQGLPVTKYGLWSFIEANVPSVGRRPPYSQNGSHVETFTATVAFPGVEGWGEPGAPSSTAGFRGDGTTFRTFINYAKALKPTFLLVNQFNQFTGTDQGFSAETTNDIEPSNLWGDKTMTWVRSAIEDYRNAVGGANVSVATIGETAVNNAVEKAKVTTAPNVVNASSASEGLFRVGSSAAVYYSNGQGHYCTHPNLASFTESHLDFANVRSVERIADNQTSDGACVVKLRAGFVEVGPTIYSAIGDGNYCAFTNFADFVAAGGTTGNVRKLDGFPHGNTYVGPCNSNTPTATAATPASPAGRDIAAAASTGVAATGGSAPPPAAPAIAPGFFRIGPGTPGIYQSKGGGHYCAFANPASYLAAGGMRNQKNVSVVYSVPPSMINDGICGM